MKSNRGNKPAGGYFVGIDMGASHLHFALADTRGKILCDAECKIRPEDGPRRLIAQIKEGVQQLAAGRKNPGRLRGLGVCVPSPVHPMTNFVSFANNLPGWRNIDLARELGRAFCVPLRIENDANAAAVGERWRGVAKNTNDFVFVAIGTGIGAGIFAGGRLQSGRTGSAGELFRMNLEWARWREDFGDTGYFEGYVSGLGIAAMGRAMMKRQAVNSATGLSAERDARFVFDAFNRGDKQARAVLEKIFTILGVGVANLVSVLDPELIVLGGGIGNGAPEFMLATARKVVKAIHPDPPRVVLSALGDKAQTHGAIFLALEAAGTFIGPPAPLSGSKALPEKNRATNGK